MDSSAPRQRALLVIDMQNELVDFLKPARRGQLVSNVRALIRQARAHGTPIVFVRHNEDAGPLEFGTTAWEIASDVAPHHGEPIVEKRHADAFRETTLSDVLASLKSDDLVVCGMQSDHCVGATVRGAVERGFHVTLAKNAHATYDEGGKTEAEIVDELHRELSALGVTVSEQVGRGGAGNFPP